MSPFKYEFTPQARNDLKKISSDIRERILRKLAYYQTVPNPLVLAERLVNYRVGEYRFRIGDYRVVFDVKMDKIFILKIGHRREIYK